MSDATRLTLRGGRVIDPASGTDTVTDLRVEDGRIVAIGPLPDDGGGEVLDVRGRWVLK